MPLDPRRPRPTTPQRRPPTALELAIGRRPPCAADRYRARARASVQGGGDYSQQHRTREHAERLRRAECRAMAWLVCRALGDAWRFEVEADCYRASFRLVHRATTATLTFRSAWRDDARYEIVPENVYRSDQLPRSISVSGERSPASIAADIERRIVAAGLFDQNAAHLHAGHERRRLEVQRRRRLLAVARAYGGELAREQHWKSRSYPEAAATLLGPAVEDSNWRRETSISAATDYNEAVELAITTNDLRLALAIAELVRNHYAERRAEAI